MHGPVVARWQRGYGSPWDMVEWVYLPALMAVLSIAGPFALRYFGRRKMAVALAIFFLVAWFPPAFVIAILAAI
jgi:hypothetical protein